MATRTDKATEAERRARHRVHQAISECRQERLRAGISQRQVAQSLGCSRQLITALEAEKLMEVGLTFLSRYASVVGLDLSVRLYPSTRLIRDIGQVRLLDRFHALIGNSWVWRTEVPVSRDPRDLRAIDAVISRARGRVGVEAITRLVDTQAQIRPILVKQQTGALDCMVLLLADTRHNRAVLQVAGGTMRGEFPLRAREVLGDLRAGRQPSANGLVLA